MIHITLKRKNQIVTEIYLKGHALYEDYGKDIVCAGVSAILTTTINGILKIKENAITYLQKKDFFQITIQSQDNVTKALIENMLDLFQELAKTYPKNIKIEGEEET
ncbi:MAG: ribosomal-processing cysteine protease Prp [Bacilli bacterium]|jgi:uncharacterized protein YsxB (DUF464 family)|nr:ribosomal-processing cysteine protease Prp [Bacilli bacterium]